jgi:hypothetical protein
VGHLSRNKDDRGSCWRLNVRFRVRIRRNRCQMSEFCKPHLRGRAPRLVWGPSLQSKLTSTELTSDPEGTWVRSAWAGRPPLGSRLCSIRPKRVKILKTRNDPARRQISYVHNVPGAHGLSREAREVCSRVLVGGRSGIVDSIIGGTPGPRVERWIQTRPQRAGFAPGHDSPKLGVSPATVLLGTVTSTGTARGRSQIAQFKVI